MSPDAGEKDEVLAQGKTGRGAAGIRWYFTAAVCQGGDYGK